jgi:hypothetical protein
MKAPECPREHAIVAAVLAGRWPERCDEGLREHAAGCEGCRELVEVVSVMRDERDALHERASVPAAGQVWWRAAIRARLEAGAAVSRPLDWMFGSAGACAVGLAVAAVGLLWPSVQRASLGTGFQSWTPGIDLGAVVALVAPLVRVSALFAFGAVTCIVLASVAFWTSATESTGCSVKAGWAPFSSQSTSPCTRKWR